MSMVIAAALGLFFLVTLPQLLARQADARRRAEVDALPERVRPVTPATHAAASDPSRATAPLLPRARRVEVARGIHQAPNLSLIQGGAEDVEQDLVEAHEETERYQLPLASGELHPAMHTAVESETTMTVTASSGPQRPRLPRSSGGTAASRGTAGSQTPAPRNATVASSSTAGGARPGTRSPAAAPASTIHETPVRRSGDDGSAGSWTPAPRKPVLLPLLGLVVLAGLGLGIVLAALAAFGIVTWSGAAACGVVTILALMGVRSINVAHRERIRAHRAAHEDAEPVEDLEEEPSAPVAEDIAGAARREQMARLARSRRAAEARSVEQRAARGRGEERTAAPRDEFAESASVERETVTGEIPVQAPARAAAVGFDLDDPISFDEVSADAPAEIAEPATAEAPATEVSASQVPAAETWTPKSMPLPTYVDAPRATSARGAADASLAEALAMEFASRPGQRPEVDATLAHGRTAIRGGKAEPQANKTVRAASELDSVLQRRRA